MVLKLCGSVSKTKTENILEGVKGTLRFFFQLNKSSGMVSWNPPRKTTREGGGGRREGGKMDKIG